MNTQFQKKKLFISLGIILASLGLTYIPLPGVKQTIVVVSGTELKEPLQELETSFEQSYSSIDLELKFQGSQDIVNNYIDQKNDFTPAIIIPASGEILDELNTRWKAQNNQELFDANPQAIAKTLLVAIAWQERAKILFSDGNFSWSKIEQAMKQKNWAQIGGLANWGSFDFITTDPTRSNSGQLTLSLWIKSTNNNLNIPETESLVTLIKQSVYQPPRSTDILLQEFISRGANDGDIAMVYESIALHRWSQAQITQGQPYQIYYPNPTIETVATAAIVRQNIDNNTAKAARKFINYIIELKQQEVFVKYGFRSIISDLNLSSTPNSPWSQNIAGAMINPSVTIESPPSSQEIAEIQRLWSRVR
jgi:ABC-type molybdate transport system substrate-binding protein